METTFAQTLRALRSKKGLTQTELARRSKLSLRTLAYWETGKTQPRLPELRAALAALAATPDEAARLHGLLTTPRSLRLVEATLEANAPPSFPSADSGDLLRAMRMRRGMTQEELADKLRINRMSVARWEAMRVFPTEEHLARLCLALNAYPEEKEALLSGKLRTDGERKWTMEECEAQTRCLHRAANSNDVPLMDLHSLALKRQLRMQTAYSEMALHLLGSVELYQAYWLHLQNRVAESQAAMNRAMACMREQGKPEFYWTGVLNQASSRTTARLGHLQGGLVVYRQWAARLPSTRYRLFPLCDAALHMAKGGDPATAYALLADAERLVSGQAQEQAAAEKHWRMARARIEIQTDLSVEALQWLLEQLKAPPAQILVHTEWITALWRHGETREAAQAFAALEQQHPDAVSLPFWQRCAQLFS